MNREVAHSLARNTTVMMSSQVITGILSFTLMLFLPRHLGTEDYGRLYLGLSLQAMFQMIIYFGGRYYIVKEIARDREKGPQLVSNSLGIRIVLWLLAFVTMIGFSFVANYPPEVKLITIIFGISMLWEGMRLVYYCCYQAHEIMNYPSVATIAEKLLVTGVGICALLLGANSVIIAAIMAFGTLLNFAVCRRFLKRVVAQLPSVKWKESLGLVRMEFPYFLLAVFGVIYFRIDAVMLSLMTSEVVVGWYGAAYRFFDILMFFPSIFIAALFPILSKLWGKESGTMAHTAHRSIELMITTGIPLTIVVFSFAENIIGMFFGLEAFGGSVGLLKIFAVGLLFIYINFVLGTTIFASDKQKNWSWVTLGAVILNIVLNSIFIPFTQNMFGNGGIGSAIATVTTEVYIMVAAINMMSVTFFRDMRIGVLVKSSIAGIVMMTIFWMLQSSPLHWIILAAIGVIVYGLVILFLGIVRPSELEFLREFFTIRNLKSTFVPSKGGNA